MPMDSSLAPFGQVLRKLCMFKPWQSPEPLPGHGCTRALSHDKAPIKLPYLLAHTSDWADGLNLVTLNLCDWEAIPTPGAFTHIRITWALSPTTAQVPSVIPGSPLCPWCFGHSSWRGVRQRPHWTEQGKSRVMTCSPHKQFEVYC